MVRLFGKVIPSPSSVKWEEKATINVQTCLHYEGSAVPPNLCKFFEGLCIYQRRMMNYDVSSEILIYYLNFVISMRFTTYMKS